MPPKGQIQGLVIRQLQRFADERGDFREILRAGNSEIEVLKQVSASVVFTGVIKAWHLHNLQTEAMTLVSGVARFVFADRRDSSVTKGKIDEFVVDANSSPLLFIVPPGVAHGYRIAQGPAVVIYLTSHIYDPKDQIQIPHNFPEIGYLWAAPEIR